MLKIDRIFQGRFPGGDIEKLHRSLYNSIHPLLRGSTSIQAVHIRVQQNTLKTVAAKPHIGVHLYFLLVPSIFKVKYRSYFGKYVNVDKTQSNKIKTMDWL